MLILYFIKRICQMNEDKNVVSIKKF